MGDVDIGGIIPLGEIQTSGIDKFTDISGNPTEIDYDWLLSEKDNLIEALATCNLEYIDCDARCKGVSIISSFDNQQYSCYQECGVEQGDEELRYFQCLEGFGDAVFNVMGSKANKYSTSACPEYLPYTNRIQAEMDACSAKCPVWKSYDDNTYDNGVCAGKCLVQWIRKDQAYSVCEGAKAALKSHEYFEKWIEAVNGDQGTESSKSLNTDLGSAATSTYSENTDRGLTGGKINPSISGYLGDAYVVRSDGTKVIPGKELYLKVDDVVTTGQNSNVNIIFSNAGKMNLGPNTVVRIGNALLDQYYLDKGTLKTQLDWGSLPPQRLEFRTPNAAIISKGTEFVTYYNETTNITIVYLYEGDLEINVRDKSINLTAGNYITIYPDGTSQIEQMNPEEWNALETLFYEPASIAAIFKSAILLIELVAIFISGILVSKKIKEINTMKKKDSREGKGVASFILGIIGTLLFAIPYIGLVPSTLSVLLARIQKANKPTKLATAGLIIGIIGLILNLCMTWWVIMNALFS
jgi:hypothetical protein